jgi:hypothetical protein
LANPSSFKAFPTFFQGTEEADVRCQVAWLQENLELDRRFFCHLLELSEIDLGQWIDGKKRLRKDKLELLTNFWQLNLHVLSFFGFKVIAAKELFDADAENMTVRRSFGASAKERMATALKSSPPWAGDSMREYVAVQRGKAILEATKWITSFRFSDPYAVS